MGFERKKPYAFYNSLKYVFSSIDKEFAKTDNYGYPRNSLKE